MIEIIKEIEKRLMTKENDLDEVTTLSMPEHKFKKISDKLNNSIFDVYKLYNKNDINMSDIILELQSYFDMNYLVNTLLNKKNRDILKKENLSKVDKKINKKVSTKNNKYAKKKNNI